MSVNEKMAAIADAIREKTGGAELLGLDAMAQAIAAIKGGGVGEHEREIISGSFVPATTIKEEYKVYTGILKSTLEGDIKDYCFIAFLDEDQYIKEANRKAYEFFAGVLFRNVSCNQYSYASSDAQSVWYRNSSYSNTTPVHISNTSYFDVIARILGDSDTEYGIKFGCSASGPQLIAGRRYTWMVMKKVITV